MGNVKIMGIFGVNIRMMSGGYIQFYSYLDHIITVRNLIKLN